ncbi:hypothetical protein LINPERPRIM_LOCUS36372 [Linum perenne]
MNRFIPKFAKRQTPFFATLKATTKSSWTEECSKAFEELKVFLTTPLVLAAPLPRDELYLYVTIAVIHYKKPSFGVGRTRALASVTGRRQIV